jgi:site-specific DNA-methyltransferase (adenine-specific)
MSKLEKMPPLRKTLVMCRAVDNLELLLSQPDESVDLIYCDILYGTGKDFMDYKDLYPMREIIEAHYMRRLIEMHRVLKSTGSIYLQMDYRIEHWVRCMMDDIFGYGNFRNQIIWSYRIQGVSKKKYPSKHDNILFYSKSDTYTYKAEKERIYYNKKFFDVKIDDEGRYYSDVYVRDVWDCDYTKPLISGSSEYVNYKTQKPKALLKRIISNSSNEGDVVADYYLGSGTTAVVCKELNRNFIGCDINPKAIEITNARLNALS